LEQGQAEKSGDPSGGVALGGAGFEMNPTGDQEMLDQGQRRKPKEEDPRDPA
jgi:hypothetical protein